MSNLSLIVVAALLSPYLLIVLNGLRERLAERRFRKDFEARNGRPYIDYWKRVPLKAKRGMQSDFPYNVK
jgi:hypothetical protein